jgi:uncharacterized protein YdaU (DUF1376 family)
MGGRGVNAYLFLLCEAWLQTPSGSLPNDEDLLMELARVTQPEWDAIWPVIKPKFISDGNGRLYNTMLKQEAKGVTQRQHAGKSGWTEERRKQQARRMKRTTKGK